MDYSVGYSKIFAGYQKKPVYHTERFKDNSSKYFTPFQISFLPLSYLVPSIWEGYTINYLIPSNLIYPWNTSMSSLGKSNKKIVKTMKKMSFEDIYVMVYRH